MHMSLEFFGLKKLEIKVELNKKMPGFIQIRWTVMMPTNRITLQVVNDGIKTYLIQVFQNCALY